MSTQTPQETRPTHKSGKLALVGIVLLCLVVFGAVIFILCNFRVQYVEQASLMRQRDLQQSWLDKSMEAIRVWENQLSEQATFISSSEMFRLFVMDISGLAPGQIRHLASLDALHDSDETTRGLSEQLHYIQDLLKDFTERRAWKDARILMPDGSIIAEPPYSSPLDEAQVSLVTLAAASGTTTYGPVRQSDGALIMDVADPLYEVLGADDRETMAVMLLSVPVGNQLLQFLSQSADTTPAILPRIVNRDGDKLVMISATSGVVTLAPISAPGLKLESTSFGLHEALDGRGEVYSTAGLLSLMRWLYVLETPAAEMEASIHTQKVEIYGLGALASVGLALLAAWIWAGLRSKRHAAEARKFRDLYTTINNQKMVLDSINASFRAGLVLVDNYGRVQISNPAFAEICDRQSDIPSGTPLVDTLPKKAALRLLEDIGTVASADHPASDEITLGQPPEERLYRVTLYPYSSEKGASTRGCVAVFQDITEFRRKAEEARRKAENERKRQATLISAFVRAVESVDPHLVGHSDKMAAVADLLSNELNLSEEEQQTLNLSAKLSQVGKMYVPRELLQKKERLTEEELQEMRRAPEYADKILHDMRFDLPVRETVAMVGERFNGTGKPRGLTGEEIPLCGRALAVVNSFIAMTSPRAWRGKKPMSVQEALAQLAADPGFDPLVVQAMQKIDPALLEQIIAGNARAL